jgi:hypothetical protein
MTHHFAQHSIQHQQQHLTVSPTTRLQLSQASAATEFMCAAMRLLGFVEPRTLHLAMHCWRRVESVIGMWDSEAAAAAASPATPRGAWAASSSNCQRFGAAADGVAAVFSAPGTRASVADMQRGTALATLWSASKCEEPRHKHAKSSAVAALLPPHLAALGVRGILLLEMWVMRVINWAPYSGFNM